MGRAILLIVNREKAEAVEAAAMVADLVRQHGRLVEVRDSGSDEPLPTAGEVDMVVTLGGDGTLLEAARLCRDLGRPLLGINVGTVGFMAGYELEALPERAAELFGDGPLMTRRLPTLTAQIDRTDNGGQSRIEAVNEFVITAGPPYRMLTLELTIGGSRGPVVSCDGLIISSPMGSTAHNVSAGGPIVAPGVGAMIITPIAAHSLSFRPIVVSSDTTVGLRVIDANGLGTEGTTLIADGQVHRRLCARDSIEIATSDGQTELVIDPSTSYWDTLMNKMQWAKRPKRRGVD